jgi:hypothetical protein
MHEAWPKGHHLAPPDLAIRQRQLCSGARPSAQPYVACATRSESLPITSRAGNDRNASPGELDFMHGGMTRRHEGSCEHDAHRKRLEYSTASAPLQGSLRRKAGCKPTSTAFRVFSVLTMSTGALQWNDRSCWQNDFVVRLVAEHRLASSHCGMKGSAYVHSSLPVTRCSRTTDTTRRFRGKP